MKKWRIDAKLVSAWRKRWPILAAIGRDGSEGPVIAVDGWSAAGRWIDAWACRGSWIVIDHSAHPDVCRGMNSDTWQVLWYERIDADDVWAMLAELRGRGEKEPILVVRQVADRAALDEPGFASLRTLCLDYRATLLAVIQPP